MNYKFKKADDMMMEVGKSLMDLIGVLQDIDENSSSTAPNETTITGDDGETIILGIKKSGNTVTWTVTQGYLKLAMSVSNYDKSTVKK